MIWNEELSYEKKGFLLKQEYERILTKFSPYRHMLYCERTMVVYKDYIELECGCLAWLGFNHDVIVCKTIQGIY